MWRSKTWHYILIFLIMYNYFTDVLQYQQQYLRSIRTSICEVFAAVSTKYPQKYLRCIRSSIYVIIKVSRHVISLYFPLSLI